MTLDSRAVPANIPQLVAHRGYMLHYPENTLIGLAAALAAGACFIEFDVHLSRDGVPVVLHDAELLRTGGRQESVFELDAGQLAQISVHEPARLGERFAGEPVPTLEQVVRLLQRWPQARAFVEIKRKSLEHFGTDRVVRRVLDVLAPVMRQCIIISFDAPAVERARAMGAPAIGWVFEPWTEEARAIAQSLRPEYLFTDYETLPRDVPEPFWSGSWQWAVYDVTDPDAALALAARGVALVETMAIGEMLRDARLAQRRCVHVPAG